MVHVGGTGTFESVVADLNGDGKADLVVSGHSGATLYALIGRGDGTFDVPKQFKVGEIPRGVAVGDFNGDHIPDVAVATAGDNSIWVLLGTGDGSFHKGTPYKAGYGPFEIVAGDFNGDEKIKR